MAAPPRPKRSNPSQLDLLYEVGDVLGQGEFGVIRRCVHRASCTAMACKTFSKKLLLSLEDLANVHREINIMRALSKHAHPHILRLHEVLEDDANIYLILELCHGGDLDHMLTRSKAGRFSERQAARVMKSLMQSVAFCHSMGIIHRDLKLTNILFSHDAPASTIKLADFGISVRFKPGQSFSEVAGTPYYIAPEVL